MPARLSITQAQRDALLARPDTEDVLAAELQAPDQNVGAALVQRLGLRQSALGRVQQGQVVEPGADIGVVGAERLLGERQAALGDLRRFSVLAGLIELHDLGVECGQIIRLWSLGVRGGREGNRPNQRHDHGAHPALRSALHPRLP